MARRIALAAFAALATISLAPAVHAAAGQVIFSIGEARAVDAAGSARPLAKGTAIEAGDTLVTGRGRAQIRFTDGGFVSLAQNTEFKVEAYNYPGEADGSERSLFSLVKGGLRTLTGAIGRANRNNYRLATPVATIGIRGTGIAVNECVEDCLARGRETGWYFNVTKGSYEMRGDGWSRVAALGDYTLRVSDPKSPAVTEIDPIVGFSNTAPGQDLRDPYEDVDNQTLFLAGEQLDAEGNPIAVPVPVDVLPTIGPFVGVLADGFPSVFQLTDAFVDSLTEPRRVLENLSGGGAEDLRLIGGTVTDIWSSADALIFRWSGPGTYIIGVPGSTPDDSEEGIELVGNRSVHFVLGGQPMPLPMTTEAYGSFNLAATTRSTSLSGSSIGAGFTRAELELYFSASPEVYFDGTVRHGGVDYFVYGGSPVAPLTGAGGTRALTFGDSAGGSFSASCSSCGESSLFVELEGSFFNQASTSIGTVPKHAGVAVDIATPDRIEAAALLEFRGLSFPE